MLPDFFTQLSNFLKALKFEKEDPQKLPKKSIPQVYFHEMNSHSKKINAKEGSELTNRNTTQLHAQLSKQAEKTINSNETLIFVVAYDKLSNTIWYFNK